MTENYSNITIHTPDRVVRLWQRQGDNYIDLVALAAAFGCQVGNWWIAGNAEVCVQLITRIAREEGHGAPLLVTVPCGMPGGITTYGHPGIAFALLQWLAPSHIVRGSDWEVGNVFERDFDPDAEWMRRFNEW